jgi:type IV pilus assembly protein PilM
MARTVVGLDIGNTGVRAAEFQLGRRTTSLRRFASVDLPEDVIRYGMVVDPDAVTAALRELWSRGKFSSKAVVLGIANDGVLVRQMDLEWMPPADFRKGLRYQVADALPVPVDEANLDYYMLDEIEQAADGKADARRVARVMLVAAGREMVDTFVRSVQAAGLRPVRVDLLPFALVRAASSVVGSVADADAPLEAVVDIGADTVVVVVHQGGRPQFVRTLAGHGGHAITRALMARYEWTWEEAERTKISLGLPGHARRVDSPALESPDSRPAEETQAPHPAHETIVEQVDGLVAELRATLTFFRTSTADPKPLSRVVLAGRASGLGGLAETLGEQLGVPIDRLSVLDRVRTPRRLHMRGDTVTALAVPAGLCLGMAS